MKILKLTNDQFETIEKMLDYEWEQELTFQSESSEPDVSLLKEYLDIYKVLYGSKYDRASFIDVLVATDILNSKESELKKLCQK